MTDDNELHQRIRQRAYQLWEQAGRPSGQHAEHWELAAQQVVLDASRDDAAKQPKMAGTGSEAAKSEAIKADAAKLRG